MQHIVTLTLVFVLAGGSGAAGAREGADSSRRLLQEDKGKKKGSEKKARKDRQKPEADAPAATARDGLRASGTLKTVKGSPFYSFDYVAIEGKKATKKSAFVKLGERVEFYTDKLIRISDLQQGDSVWLLGFPFESEAQGGPNGYSGTDRQIKNVLAVARGVGLDVNRSYRDARDPNVRWCEATVAKAGESIDVQYDGGRYKVVLGKGAMVVHRERAGDAKALKSGVQVEVSGGKTDDRPETKSPGDARKEAFEAKKVVLLDRRLQATLYPMLNG